MNLQRFATGNVGRPAGSDGPKRRGNSKEKKKSNSVVTPLPCSRPGRAAGKRGEPTPETVEIVRVPTRRVPPRVDPEVERQTTKYIVQPGDTLHKLARRFGTTPKELATLNNLHKPVILLAGDVLLVPDHKG
jgi:LysM repeat protein